MRTFLVTLLLMAAGSAKAVFLPPIHIPRLDPDGLRLPVGAAGRLGSGAFVVGNASIVTFSQDCGVVYVGRSVRGNAPGLVAWDAATGKPIWMAFAGISVLRIVPTLDEKTAWIAGYEYINDAFRVVVANIRVADGEVLSLRRFTTDEVHLTQVTPTGRVTIGNSMGVEVYDPGNEKAVLKVPNKSTTAIQTVVLSRDGKQLLTAVPGGGASGRDTLLTTFEVPTGKKLWENEATGYSYATPHPDGRRVWMQLQRSTARDVIVDGVVTQATTYEWGELELRDLKTGKAEELQPLDRYTERGKIGAPLFRPGGRSALASFQGGFAEFELPTWRLKRRLFEVPSDGSHWLSPDGNTLAVVNGSLALFDVKSGKRIGGRLIGWQPGNSMTFANRCVTLRRSEATMTFDLATGRELDTAKRSTNSSSKVASKGGKLIVRRGDQEQELSKSEGYLGSASLTTDGKYAYCGDNNYESIRVWDTATGELKHDLFAASPGVGGSSRSSNCTRCSPDNRHLAFHEFDQSLPSGESQWVVSVWNLATGKLVRRLSGPGRVGGNRGLHWANDGRSVVVSGSANEGKNVKKLGFVAIVNPYSSDPPQTLATEQLPDQVALSEDGQAVAVASDHKIVFWDTKMVAMRHTIATPSFDVQAMAFTPDGKQFITDSENGTFLWMLPDLTQRPIAPMPRSFR